MRFILVFLIVGLFVASAAACVTPTPIPTVTPTPVPTTPAPTPTPVPPVPTPTIPPTPGPTPGPGPVVIPEAGSPSDEGSYDGAGYVLWDNLVSPSGRSQGYYYYAFNQSRLWISIRGSGASPLIEVSGSYGTGVYVPARGGIWTIRLIGESEIDGIRVLGADKAYFGPSLREIMRTRNYLYPEVFS
jgi:hypothetical protein